MAMLPIAAASMPAARPAIRNAEHALDAADRATNAGAKRAADRATDRTGCTIAFARSLVRTPLHASDDALRVHRMRNGYEGQRGCHSRYRDLQPDGSFDRQYSDSYRHVYLCPFAGSAANGP
jgi:hypothetical protein